MPRAVKLLEQRIHAGSLSERAMACELMGHLGVPEENTSVLRHILGARQAREIPTGDGLLPVTEGWYTGPDRRFKGPDRYRQRTMGDIAFDAMLRMRERGDQFEFLLAEGRPSSITREIALARLASSTDPRAPRYHDFLQLAGNPRSVSNLSSLMSKMPDARGAQMVFEEALTLGGDRPEAVRDLLREAISQVPSLRSRALDMVSTHVIDQNLERVLWRVAKSTYDKAEASRAASILEGARTNGIVDQISTMAMSGEAGHQQALDMAAGLNDYRVIRPLIQIAAEGTPPTSARSAEILRGFSPTVVRYYVRELMRGQVISPTQGERVLTAALPENNATTQR